jgi:hypothetical protein
MDSAEDTDPTSEGEGSTEKPGVGRRVASGLRRSLVVLTVFMGLNLVLYVGQSLLKRDDIAKAEAMEGQIAQMGEEMAQLEDVVDNHEVEGIAIDSLAMRLQGPESGFASIAERDSVLREHNSRVNEWNLQMSSVAAAATRHNALVDQHNRLVAEYNVVLRNAHARWWLLPFPAPSRTPPSTAAPRTEP